MMQRIKDTLGNIAEVITEVTHDGKEHVIIKKTYKAFDEQEAEQERLDREDIASKCIKDWRDFFNDKSSQREYHK
jgi:hypothetical protein